MIRNTDRCICGEVLYTEIEDYSDYRVVSFRGAPLDTCPGCGRDAREGLEEKLYQEINNYEPLVRCGTCQPPHSPTKEERG